MSVRLPIAPFRVSVSGGVRRMPYHSTRGAPSGVYVLRFFAQGMGVYRISRTEEERVVAGMVGLFPPGDSGMLMADPDDPYEMHFCYFSGDYACQLAEAVLADRGGKIFPPPHPWRILELLREMGEFSNPELCPWLGKREGALAYILGLLHPNRREFDSATLSGAVLENYLRRHISEPTDLSRIAHDFGVSRASLCRLVKNVTGKTVLQIHEEMKMERACALLQTGGLNVSEAALRVGYASPFYFSRVFKKHFGVSPKQWAQAHASA